MQGGQTIGATDELGLYAIEDTMHVRDIHASILWLLGLNNMRLTYNHFGRPERPTINEALSTPSWWAVTRHAVVGTLSRVLAAVPCTAVNPDRFLHSASLGPPTRPQHSDANAFLAMVNPDRLIWPSRAGQLLLHWLAERSYGSGAFGNG